MAVVAEAGRNPYYDMDQTMDRAPVEQVADAAAEVHMHRVPVEKVAETVAEVCMRRRQHLLPLPHRRVFQRSMNDGSSKVSCPSSLRLGIRKPSSPNQALQMQAPGKHPSAHTRVPCAVDGSAMFDCTVRD